jgi:dipeptide transport system permease protein
MAVAEIKTTKPQTGFAEFWFYFSRNKGAVMGLAVFLIILFVAVFAAFVAPHSPSVQNRDVLLLPPGWTQGGQWTYLLGTDAVGRDILSRLIYGARFSLFKASAAMLASPEPLT